MKKEVEVTRCYNGCPFFGNSMDGMQCNHPYWKDKGAYANMIITQCNTKNGRIPDKCPLRKEQLTIDYKIKDTKKCPMCGEISGLNWCCF